MKANSKRREIIKTGLGLGLALPFLGNGFSGCKSKITKSHPSELKNKGLKILILGGTSFLGPHQIAYALNRGHSISTFTRGKTQPTIYKHLFSEVEQLVGDRENDLSALENRKWDAVIDNSGHKAKWTRDSASLLRENCDLYLYTSSTGVYYPYLTSEIEEEMELVTRTPAGVSPEEKMEYDYGVMKTNSEREVIENFGLSRSIIVRPTYMFGPADRTDRFIHWPIRLDKGGEVMVPGKTEDPVQYIDVRDVAEWMIRLIESRGVGTYNAAGPKKAQTMIEFVRMASSSFTQVDGLVQIDDYEFLKSQGIHYIVPWIMPTGNNWGSARIRNLNGFNAGLSCRSLNQSIGDTLKWWKSDAIPESRREKVENHPESLLFRESQILKEWKTRANE